MPGAGFTGLKGTSLAGFLTPFPLLEEVTGQASLSFSSHLALHSSAAQHLPYSAMEFHQ